jgi:hypothetical protein
MEHNAREFAGYVGQLFNHPILTSAFTCWHSARRSRPRPLVTGVALSTTIFWPSVRTSPKEMPSNPSGLEVRR